jgi:predicted deacylase
MMPEPAAIPRFPVDVAAPDITPWLAGNTGIPGFTTIEAPAPGPHVLITALMHGNEIGGAIVLDRLLRQGPRPLRGRLTLGFMHLAAYARFDPDQPTASRFIDEDMNRVWDPAVLDGPRTSTELARARAMRPLIDAADVLVDLHSMLWPSEPLVLSGISAKGRALAIALAVPGPVVADRGHQTGPRLIDYPRFVDDGNAAAAVLVEAGQHWQPETVTVMQAAVEGALLHTGMAPPGTPPPGISPGTSPGVPRCAEVTMAVTATTSSFAFVQPFRGGDVIPRRNTLIAIDNGNEIRTPHDDCLLIMPSLRASRGHTAVRLARFI